MQVLQAGDQTISVPVKATDPEGGEVRIEVLMPKQVDLGKGTGTVQGTWTHDWNYHQWSFYAYVRATDAQGAQTIERINVVSAGRATGGGAGAGIINTLEGAERRAGVRGEH